MINSTLKVNRTTNFASDNVNSNAQGVLATATAGTITNIDLKLLDDQFIAGGLVLTNGTAFGDYIDLQVIDIDNILGYGVNTVLGQYYTSWYLRTDSQEQLNERTEYPAKILAGLYLRAVYHSTGSSPVQVAINYRLHKALF